MKWFAIPALLMCSLNSMLASIVLCLAAYYVLTDKGSNPPIKSKEQWIDLVKLLIPFSCFWMILSIFGMYVSMTKKQMYATLVLTFYVLCCGGSIYFTIGFENQLEVKETMSEALYQATLQEIQAHPNSSKETWIPAWLDKFQKNSKFCCGINTFRDYEEFWPDTPNRLPRSCCKDDPSTLIPCPPDTLLIPYPNTPDDFFKVEAGCADEVLNALRHLIRESHQNCITMTIFIVCAILAYLILYAILFLNDDYPATGNKRTAVLVVERGDALGLDDSIINADKSSGPIVVNSSGLRVASLDSIEVKVKPLGSAPDRQTQIMGKHVTLLPAVVSSVTKINKKNAVIDGLQQQKLQDQQKLQKLEEKVKELEKQAEQLQQRHQHTQEFQQQQPQQFQHPIQIQADQLSLKSLPLHPSPEPQQQQQLFQQLQQAQLLQQQQILRLQQLHHQQQSQVQDEPVEGVNTGTSNHNRVGTSNHNRVGTSNHNRAGTSNHNRMYDAEEEAVAPAAGPTNHVHLHKISNSFPQTGSVDDFTDMARTEQQQDDPGSPLGSPFGSPPLGSPKGRLKKVRREAIRNKK